MNLPMLNLGRNRDAAPRANLSGSGLDEHMAASRAAQRQADKWLISGSILIGKIIGIYFFCFYTFADGLPCANFSFRRWPALAFYQRLFFTPALCIIAQVYFDKVFHNGKAWGRILPTNKEK